MHSVCADCPLWSYPNPCGDLHSLLFGTTYWTYDTSKEEEQRLTFNVSSTQGCVGNWPLGKCRGSRISGCTSKHQAQARTSAHTRLDQQASRRNREGTCRSQVTQAIVTAPRGLRPQSGARQPGKEDRHLRARECVREVRQGLWSTQRHLLWHVEVCRGFGRGARQGWHHQGPLIERYWCSAELSFGQSFRLRGCGASVPHQLSQGVRVRPARGEASAPPRFCPRCTRLQYRRQTRSDCRGT